MMVFLFNFKRKARAEYQILSHTPQYRVFTLAHEPSAHAPLSGLIYYHMTTEDNSIAYYNLYNE